MLIPDVMIEAAFEWLQENTGPAAAAKADRIRAEYATKRVKARLFLEAEGTVAERDAQSLAHPDFGAVVKEEAEAVRLDEWHRNQRNKSEAIIEAWRTEQSSMRALGKIG